MMRYWTRPPQSAWLKASFCQTGECAEVTRQDNTIVLRNSRRPRKVVRYTPEEWQAFAAGLRAGEFNHLG